VHQINAILKQGRRDPRVVSEPIELKKCSDWITVRLGYLKTFQQLRVLPHQDLYGSELTMADEPVGCVVLPFRDFHNLACQGKCRLMLAPRRSWPRKGP